MGGFLRYGTESSLRCDCGQSAVAFRPMSLCPGLYITMAVLAMPAAMASRCKSTRTESARVFYLPHWSAACYPAVGCNAHGEKLAPSPVVLVGRGESGFGKPEAAAAPAIKTAAANGKHRGEHRDPPWYLLASVVAPYACACALQPPQ